MILDARVDATGESDLEDWVDCAARILGNVIGICPYGAPADGPPLTTATPRMNRKKPHG
jgi:hypothetical protein